MDNHKNTLPPWLYAYHVLALLILTLSVLGLVPLSLAELALFSAGELVLALLLFKVVEALTRLDPPAKS